MSSGSPFYHFAACNMCSFPVSHSTNILVSFCLQHHGPTMCYPRVLPASLFHSPPVNPCACPCLQEGQWSQSHKSSDTYAFPVKWPAIFPRTQSRSKGLASVGEPANLCPLPCQRCGHRKHILLRNLFVTAASRRPGCKQVLYFGSPHCLTLS